MQHDFPQQDPVQTFASLLALGFFFALAIAACVLIGAR
jgi:hypothetical protein